MSKDSKPIIIDNGGHTIKAGFGGNDLPASTFTTVVGKPKYCKSTKIRYVGDNVEYKQNILNIISPIKNKIIKSWDDMLTIWDHTFNNELKVDIEQHPILLTEPPLNPKSNRERITQDMFEVFYVPSMYVSTQPVLSLYGSGRMTGVVIDSGIDITYCVPIWEGNIYPNTIKKLDLGGNDITQYLTKELRKCGHTFQTCFQINNVNDIKETLCYVAPNYEIEIQNSEISMNIEEAYELPDGQMIIINQQRFKCCEILFDPGIINKKCNGIHELINQCILKCDQDIHKDLYSNIVLSGGNTLFEGLQFRLQNEMNTLLYNNKNKSYLIAPKERQYLSWIGGSIISTLSTFNEMWISKHEYEEYGPTIVHKKCF